MGDYMSEGGMSRLIGKEVINVRDGGRIGRITDVIVDCKSGNVSALIVPVIKGFFSFFGKKREYCIKWCNVVKAGTDIVLIDTDAKGCIKMCEE